MQPGGARAAPEADAPSSWSGRPVCSTRHACIRRSSLAADRLDVSEELVRLRSHVEQFRSIVATGRTRATRWAGACDFLLQEFGREANTIGSKGSDAPIAHEVVELKTELERLREQVQNIE